MIGPVLKNGLQLRLTGEIVSRPYINLTLQLMKDFGASASWTSDQSIPLIHNLTTAFRLPSKAIGVQLLTGIR